jgi:hypothetical protein
MESMFDRTERGLGSTSLSVPDIVAKTRGNPQQILQMVMGGQINVTQGLLAKRMSDAVISERAKMQAASPTVLQESFPEMAPQQGGLAGAPQAPPQSVPSSPTAEGGLGAAPIPEQMFQGGGQGGVAAFAEGDSVMPGLPDYLTPKEVDLEEMRALIPQRQSSANDAYRDAIGAPIDQDKVRKRDEMLAILGSIGQVQPGTNPLQAFMQGMGGTAKSLAASEKERKAASMAQFKALAEMEDRQNQFTQQDFNLMYQLKQAKEGRLDAAAKNALDVDMKRLDRGHAKELLYISEKGANYRSDSANATSRANANTSASAQRAGNTSADRATMAAMMKQAGDVVARAKEEVVATNEGRLLKLNSPAAYNRAVAAAVKQQAGAYNAFPELQNIIMDAANSMAVPKTPKAAKAPKTTGGRGGTNTKKQADPLAGFSAKPIP